MSQAIVEQVGYGCACVLMVAGTAFLIFVIARLLAAIWGIFPVEK